MELILRPHPAPLRLRHPTLLHPNSLHLLIPPPLQHLLPAQRDRRADLHFPPTLPFERLVRAQHVQVPQRETSGQAVPLLQRDGVRELQKPEVRDAVLGAHAHADELDFRDDEAVAGVVLAHHALQVGKMREVFHVRLAFAVAHACVPDVVGFDQTDEAAAPVAAERLGRVVGVGGEEVRAVVAIVLGLHGDVTSVSLAGLGGGVDLGGVEARDDVLKSPLVGGLKGGGADDRGGECGSFDGDVEQTRLLFDWGEYATGEAGDGADGLKIKVLPGTQITYVPPAMAMDTGANGEASNGTDGGVGAG